MGDKNSLSKRFAHWWSAILNVSKEAENHLEYQTNINQEIDKLNNLLTEERVIIEAQNEVIRQQSEQLKSIQTWIDAHNQVTESHQHTIEFLNKSFESFNETVCDSIVSNRDILKKLHTALSIAPVIWGAENRLHISEKAAVNSCTFNTNSGYISIGDYTFAGSNVSILAGSHDLHLSGMSRRDSEYKEGFDITIGKGVWLASNCTILGPCSIGDNAVIAAGTVVVPGTNVPANSLVVGVPGRIVSPIACDDNESITSAIERCDGVVLRDGVSERTCVEIDGEIVNGYWLLEKESHCWIDGEATCLKIYNSNDKEIKLVMNIDGVEVEHHMMNGFNRIDIKASEKNIRKLDIICSSYSGLFLIRDWT